MASNPPGKCCTVGVKHEGQSKGEITKVNGIPTYISKPEKSTDKAVLILPDVIGIEFINVQLIADQFAANGYFTVIPDLFNGDTVPLNRPEGFDFMQWKSKHTVETTDPIVEKTISWLKKDQGIAKIGAIGYCWGAKWTCRYLAKGKGIDAGAVAHPSFVDEEELRNIAGPLSIAAAETDEIFPPEKRHKSEEILKEIKARYKIALYSGTSHGFAVRGDIKDPAVKYAKEQAFYQAVEWFDEHLKGTRESAS